MIALAGFMVELGILMAALLSYLRERTALDRFVANAGSSGKLRQAAEAMPPAYRTIGVGFAEGIGKKAPIDELLVAAVEDAANCRFRAPLGIRLVLWLILISLVCMPLTSALASSAVHIAELWATSHVLDPSLVYLDARAKLEAGFSHLNTGAHETAALFAGLALVWATTWWLNRAEAREARLIRALLESASYARPSASAPVGGRLSEMVAPDRSLRIPAQAALLWMLLVTAGWGLMAATSNVKAANGSPRSFDVWPRASRHPVETSFALPLHQAGAPLEAPYPPSLTISPSNVTLAGYPLLDLVDGTLPEDWGAETPALTALIDELNAPGKDRRVLVSCVRDILLKDVLTILRHLHARYALRRFDLVLDRTVKLDGSSPEKLQAYVPLIIGPDERAPALQVAIRGDGLVVHQNRRIPFSGSNWKYRLNLEVLSQSKLYRPGGARATVEIDTVVDITYDRFVEVLAAADSVCLDTHDCGLAGLGLQFVLVDR